MPGTHLFDRQSLRHLFYILMFVAFGLVVYVILSEISGLVTVEDYQSNFVNSLIFFLGYVWVPWLIMSPIIYWISQLMPITPLNWVRQISVHCGILLLLSLGHGLIISLRYHYFHDMDHDMEQYQPWQHIGHFLFGDNLFLLNMIIYILFIANFNLRNFYSLAQTKQLETAQLNEQLSRTKLHALKMQVNPHFLFNTLNVIQVLVMKQDTSKAAETLRRLSSFLRQTLDETESQWVPLKSELDMIEQYLNIEQVRFGDRLVVNCNYDEQLMTVNVPSMLLQPLVENAMRHGLGEKQELGTLQISTQKVAGKLMILIQDDGVGCDEVKAIKSNMGIGLNNVIERLKQLYGEEQLFTLSSQPGKGCIVTIELPLKPGKEQSGREQR